MIGIIRHMANGAGVAAALLAAGAAWAADPGYLPGKSLEADLGITVPPPPDNLSELGRLDLTMVQMAQTSDPAAYEEAYRDAAAYSFDALITRFSPDAGTELNLRTAPILAHVLKLVLSDTGTYAGLAKDAGPRGRPYTEDANIIPCATDYLRATDERSYPSGHSTNGYAAALVIAEVMPARAPKILARGVRYGNNRVVCGVHHPIDVQQGRLLAIAIFAKLKENKAFVEDIRCARQQYDRSLAGVDRGKALDAACAALDAKYRAELTPKP